MSLKIFAVILTLFVANVKVSVSKIEVEMNKKQKAFKKYMSPQLSMRYTPDIQFFLDETLAYSEKIDKLLKKQHKIHRSK